MSVNPCRILHIIYIFFNLYVSRIYEDEERISLLYTNFGGLRCWGEGSGIIASRVNTVDPPLLQGSYTCANVEPFVRHQVKSLYDKDKTIAPKLIKLLYADCMVNVIEARCPGVVSCADILNIAVRDAVYFSGGPSYPVFLGRRDGRKSDAAWVDLPSPSISWESALKYFTDKGLNLQDMVTLLGGHMMGRTRCSNILDRLYDFNKTGKPDPTMEPTTLSILQKQCPKKVKLGQPNPLINLNPDNPTHKFTNSYYSRVLASKSVLGVDQQLLYGPDTHDLTDEYANGLEDFKGGFAYSMSRMGGLKVLTGKNGEIRKNCHVVNK
ncbi:putative peroxidase [Helianthus annuus]|nr:putative peroxidase [Helianthus annuus]